MLEKQGESITFSSPVEYTSELCVHLVGENLVLEQQAKLDKILVEVFYAPPIAGQTYTKVDYQLISQGDRASFVCDKSLWKTWKPDASAQNKLMFAYVRIKIPSSLKNLKIFNAYGSSKVQGNYQQLAFLSYTGSLDFQGSVEKARLETYKGALSLHGKSFEDKQAFYDLTFKTIKGKLIGKGAIKELKLYALWPSVFWQGPCEVFYARSLALESQFELKSLEKGSWSVWAWLGKLLVQVPKEKVSFDVSSGSCVLEVARSFQKKGVRISPFFFRFFWLLKGQPALKAGHYEVSPSISLWQLLEVLSQGQLHLLRVTLTEGCTLTQVAKRLEEEKVISSASEFLYLARDSKFLKELGLSFALSAEGFLFPDTYVFDQGSQAQEVLRHLVDNFWKHLKDLVPGWESWDKEKLYDKIKLASLVEKEYRQPLEAPLIASVFTNRLREGMRLESCASLIYVITEIEGKDHPSRVLWRDVALDSPYNTYKYKGLPPTPIANSGLVALKAAFEPARTNYFYFVIKNPHQGTHAFTGSFDEHSHARKAYLENYVALERLADIAKVSLPQQIDSTLKDPLAEIKKALENLNGRLVGLFEYLYQKKDRHAQEYLLQRGIDEEIRKKFALGYLPWRGQELRQFLLSKSFSLDLLARSGLFSVGSFYPLMGGRLVFPIREFSGRVVGFGGRSLDERQPKYLNSRDDPLFKKKEVLYGFYEAQHFIRKQAKVILCEGYIDVLAWHMAGIPLAVAPLGTSFTYEQACFLKRFVSKIFFCFDADAPGVNATLKSYLLGESLGLESEVILMPAGKDPADILKEKGKLDLERLYREERISTFAYLLDKLYLINNERSLGLSALLLELFKLVEVNYQETIRDKKLTLVAQKLGLSFHSLKKDFLTWLETGLLDKRSQQELLVRYQTGVLPKHERLLIKGIINHPYLFPWVRRYLLAEDLKEETMKVFYSLIEKVWQEKKVKLKADDIFDELEEDSQLRRFFLDSIVDNGVPLSPLDLEQTTCTIYGAFLDHKRAILCESIERAEQVGLVETSLMGSLNYLNQRIKQFSEYKRQYFDSKENLRE
ncbi:UNVERIFIED_CONTAM: hypothetical protein PYX00_011046 [Menopon gallinae]|uniref:Toprim domain-containing protein n=1 Tax=Menopon gallinae TaxID=328185 RepID=A0AAW2H736_9NEOP